MDNLNRLANFMQPERNELEEDQFICDKCNGTGCVPSEINPHEMASICQKCQGDGWVDWISNITGKPPRYLYTSAGTSMSSSSAYGASTSGYGVPNFIVDKMAEDLAKKIDEEILKVVVEQKINHKEVFF